MLQYHGTYCSVGWSRDNDVMRGRDLGQWNTSHGGVPILCGRGRCNDAIIIIDSFITVGQCA